MQHFMDTKSECRPTRIGEKLADTQNIINMNALKSVEYMCKFYYITPV